MGQRTEVYGTTPEDLTTRLAETLEEPYELIAEIRQLRREMRGVLTADAVGEMLGGIQAETVTGYHVENGLPVYRPGKAPLFKREDVIAYIEQHEE